MSKELELRALREAAILKELQERHQETRAMLRPNLDAGDRIRVGDSGYVQVTNPTSSCKVVDQAALLAWALAHYPEAVITVQNVSSGWIGRVLRDGGVFTHPETGEMLEVDGIGFQESSPTLRIVPEVGAKAFAEELVGSGRLTEVEA